jgi:type I restriction enzyme, S subunit
LSRTYPRRKLSELAARVDYGMTASASQDPSGPRFLRITDIVPEQLDWSTVPFAGPVPERALAKYALEVGDIVIARTGATVGYSKRIDTAVDAVFASYLVRVRVKPEHDATYIGYVVGSRAYKTFVRSNAGGAAQPNANARVLSSYEVPLPPLSVQRKIAAILSAYDDLIVNNNRRIKILEEIARRVYCEWFADFRYPGHEAVPLVDTNVGLIPEGWEVGPIGDVIETLGGGTPSKTVIEYWEPGTVTWFTPTDLTKASAMFMSSSAVNISEQGLAKSAARLFPQGSVMMTSRATIGVIAISAVSAATNQGFITCVPNDVVGPYHLYFWLVERRGAITDLASGATFKEINKKTFRNIPFVRAPSDIERRFEDCVRPIAGEIHNLLTTRATLRATRDLLLPRLISGEIDVADVDVTLSEIAA